MQSAAIYLLKYFLQIICKYKITRSPNKVKYDEDNGDSFSEMILSGEAGCIGVPVEDIICSVVASSAKGFRQQEKEGAASLPRYKRRGFLPAPRESMANLKSPDFSRLRKVLKREGEPDRVPFYELFADQEVMEAILGRPVRTLQDRIDYHVKLGYDYVVCWVKGVDFPTKGRASTADTAYLARAERTFNVASQGMIRNWDDFEQYPWPDPAQADYSEIEEAERIAPEGMKVIVLTGHVLEDPMAIMGYEGLSYACYDQPDLVEAVFDRVGQTYLSIYQDLAGMDAVGAVLISDDLGFKTQTLMPPDFLRKYVFPWYHKYVETSHASDLPVILHSCGNLSAIMEDLIDCGIDAKHSFEDRIMPVEEMKKRYGHAMTMLGGIDVDFLCRSTPDEVRARTRQVLEACMPGGGYALGTGNTVANYIPLENFLAMLDEGLKVGVYRK